MNEKQEIRYHLLFWGLFVGMDLYFEFLLGKYETFSLWLLLHKIGFFFLQALIFYWVYLGVAPYTIPQKRWLKLIGGIVISIFLFAGIRYVIEEVIIYQITGAHNYSDYSRRWLFYIYDNSYYAFRIILLSLVFYGVKYLLTVNQELHQLQLDKKQAELRVLKSQLSPHFLFNTLNSFYADALEVDLNLSNDILKLSEMLRYITYENDTEIVPLKGELTFLQHYIALFERRFDNKLYIESRFPENPGEYQIPSLLLIHFIENTFKHGILDDPLQPVWLDISIDNMYLKMEVKNAVKAGDNYDEKGIGYKNIRQRLDLIFGKTYTLNIDEEKNYFKVFLQFPLTR